MQKYSNGQIILKGTEPNIYKRQSATTRGLDVSFLDLKRHQEKYDVISLLNVYSHLPDPVEFLNDLKQLLNPGGELLLETGDTADLPAEDHYRPFYLPDHLSFASKKIVADLLRRQGFKIITIKRYPFPKRPSIKVITLLKETVKYFLPNYQSNIHLIIKNMCNYSGSARLKQRK